MRRRRIGVFGGTFDPPHHGHTIVAAEAFDLLELQKLLLVPAARPPHKRGRVVASPDQRLRMLRAAVAGDERFQVEEIELARSGTSYTVDTLRAIAAREPDAELLFLLGIDQFRSLDSWKEPHEVARLARLAVLTRGLETPDLSGPYGGVHVPVSRIDVSGTELRRRVASGRSIRYFVPEGVRSIIEEEALYTDHEF